MAHGLGADAGAAIRRRPAGHPEPAMGAAMHRPIADAGEALARGS
jgi:hypothetical protein